MQSDSGVPSNDQCEPTPGPMILTHIAGIAPSGPLRLLDVPSVCPNAALILNLTLIFGDKRTHFLSDLPRAIYVPSISTCFAVSSGLTTIFRGQFSLHAAPHHGSHVTRDAGRLRRRTVPSASIAAPALISMMRRAHVSDAYPHTHLTGVEAGIERGGLSVNHGWDRHHTRNAQKYRCRQGNIHPPSPVESAEDC